MTNLSHGRRIVLACLVALLAAGALPPAVAAANDTIASLTVTGSPFIPDGDGFRESVGVRLTLRRQARVTVTVRRPDGAIVRTLAADAPTEAGRRSWSWDGRNGSGKLVADGRYLIRAAARNALGTDAASAGLRKGLPAIYRANPSAITIVINPGHGGTNTGAYRSGGIYEKDFNLDISLKLRRLLRGAGVTVVMTRETDTAVNVPRQDVNGDGEVNHSDDLAARVDIGNLARADLHLNPHNNAAPCRCTRGTTTYTNLRRSWTPEGMDLARLLHREQLRELEQYSNGTYHPIDLGIRHRNFYLNRPFELPLVPRPSLMPAILTESLFVSNNVELALLKRADVRFSLAVAFYMAIAEYINTRAHGIRYELLQGPQKQVPAGGRASYLVAVTNRGNRTSNGWRLELRSVPAVPLYDGSGARGELMAGRAIPDGLGPGETAEIVFTDIPVPDGAGSWLVKADVRLPDGSYLAPRGVVPLQVRLTTSSSAR